MQRLQPVAGPSRIARRFVHDTPKRLAAAAQLAESEEPTPYYHNPPPSSSSHQEPSRRPSTDTQYPTREAGIVRMPSPLPPDVLFADDTTQSTMYPSSGVLDSISLIAISLRRPDLVPRALLMFNQMLSAVKTDPSRQLPQAEIWGKVIEGVASLGKAQPGEGQDPTVWLGRAEKLVGRWESMNDVATGSPALLKDGIKIYQGWLSGLLKASARLDPLLPYLSNGRIPIADMLGAIETSNLPLAFEALMELGRSSGDSSITDQVQELMGIEQQQRQLQAREIEEVAEVMPVLDVSVLFKTV